MDILLAGNGPSLLEGSLAGVDVQRRYLWKSFRAKPNTVPGRSEKCSASARNPIRLEPGIVFGINPECCSPSPRKPVRLRPESALLPIHRIVGGSRPKPQNRIRVLFAAVSERRHRPPDSISTVGTSFAGDRRGSTSLLR